MKIETCCRVSAHHQTPPNRKRSPCTTPRRPPRKQETTAKKTTNHNNRVWVPAIPAWEKAFCYEVGLFKWDKFLEAKKLTSHEHKVLGWDDSAAEEAFAAAKKRFFAKINGLPSDHIPVPNPDLYIDEVVWDDSDDDIVLEFDISSESSSDEDHEERCWEDIKPTGWEVDVKEFSAGKVLFGLVIGSSI